MKRAKKKSKAGKPMTPRQIEALLAAAKNLRTHMRRFNKEFSRAELALFDIDRDTPEHVAAYREFRRLERINERVYAALRPEFSI